MSFRFKKQVEKQSSKSTHIQTIIQYSYFKRTWHILACCHLDAKICFKKCVSCSPSSNFGCRGGSDSFTSSRAALLSSDACHANKICSASTEWRLTLFLALLTDCLSPCVALPREPLKSRMPQLLGLDERSRRSLMQIEPETCSIGNS